MRHCGDDEAGAVVDGNAVDPCDADANALISVEELINVVLDAEAVGGDNRVTVGFCGSDFDVIEEPIEDDEAAEFEVRWGRVIPSRSACVISLHRLAISCIGKGSLCMVVLLYSTTRRSFCVWRQLVVHCGPVCVFDVLDFDDMMPLQGLVIARPSHSV